jgi:hypothetical protein
MVTAVMGDALLDKKSGIWTSTIYELVLETSLL